MTFLQTQTAAAHEAGRGRIRTAIYMTKLRAEKRAKQEVFTYAHSQWNRSKTLPRINESPTSCYCSRAEKKAEKEEVARQAAALESLHRSRADPWEQLAGAPIEIVRESSKKSTLDGHTKRVVFLMSIRGTETQEKRYSGQLCSSTMETRFSTSLIPVQM